MFPADDLFSRYAQNYEGRKEVEMTLRNEDACCNASQVFTGKCS